MVSAQVRGDQETANRPVVAILPWLALTLTVILAGLAAFFFLVNQNGPASEPIPNLYGDTFYLISAIVAAAIGALIAARRHRNPIGWILLATSLVQVAEDVSTGYSEFALVTRPGALPGAIFFAWLAQWMWTLPFGTLLFGILLYPTGHMLSRRWRIVAWAGIAGNVVLILGTALASELVLSNRNPPPTLPNPVGLIDAKSIVQPILFPAAFAFLLAVLFAALASLVIRFRRARGDERQQLKWFTYAAVLALVTEAAASALLGDWAQAVQNIAFLMMPLSIGVAILKYRLYDIDLLINRTLVYVPLTAILAGIFAASITLSQKLFIAVTGEKSDSATVLTTLIVVAVFEPLKSGLQHLVDRRFKEARDPTKELRAIRDQASALLQVIDVEPSTRHLLDAAVRAFDATGGALSLQRNGQARVVYTSREWKGDAALRVPLQADGVELGELALGARRSGADYTEQDRKALQETVAPVLRAWALTARLNGVQK